MTSGIIGIIVAVVVIAIVLYFLFGKKKAKPIEKTESPLPPSEPPDL